MNSPPRFAPQGVSESFRTIVVWNSRAPSAEEQVATKEKCAAFNFFLRGCKQRYKQQLESSSANAAHTVNHIAESAKAAEPEIPTLV